MSHRIFPTRWVTCSHTKKIKLKLFSCTSQQNSKFEKQFLCYWEMLVLALHFTYLHSYNHYVRIVSASTCQTNLKKILIMQKHVIWIIFHCKCGNSCKTIISRIKYSWYMSNKPALSLHIHAKNQKIYIPFSIFQLL